MRWLGGREERPDVADIIDERVHLGPHHGEEPLGRAVVDVTRRLSDAWIPVMSHLGLTPQSVHKLGGFRQQARSDQEAERLIEDAIALESAGAFAVGFVMIAWVSFAVGSTLESPWRTRSARPEWARSPECGPFQSGKTQETTKSRRNDRAALC